MLFKRKILLSIFIPLFAFSFVSCSKSDNSKLILESVSFESNSLATGVASSDNYLEFNEYVENRTDNDIKIKFNNINYEIKYDFNNNYMQLYKASRITKKCNLGTLSEYEIENKVNMIIDNVESDNEVTIKDFFSVKLNEASDFETVEDQTNIDNVLTGELKHVIQIVCKPLNISLTYSNKYSVNLTHESNSTITSLTSFNKKADLNFNLNNNGLLSGKIDDTAIYTYIYSKFNGNLKNDVSFLTIDDQGLLTSNTNAEWCEVGIFEKEL